MQELTRMRAVEINDLGIPFIYYFSCQNGISNKHSIVVQLIRIYVKKSEVSHNTEGVTQISPTQNRPVSAVWVSYITMSSWMYRYYSNSDQWYMEYMDLLFTFTSHINISLYFLAALVLLKQQNPIWTFYVPII